MLKCKILSAATAPELERVVNQWLDNNRYSIHNQSFMFDPLEKDMKYRVMVFYEDNEYDAERGRN